ncbi:hypothetical protein CROQUDRAFT_90251 [Cronartium quercuum f. sp. fusiforme G11]|uniref:Beta-galactosidase n=1 Tax=Cronartium quercuum f. sp. fusiforme G11 TaxID=708437 RepID=A0A9P6NK68_9BASI|nr:hypothetical protein CROQUDRAFT_90251 [Cronartium quercuum f. sp. fusiforme G11]
MTAQSFIVILVGLFLTRGPVTSVLSQLASYAPKVGPLDTDWTKKVGLHPWSEYPRPQLSRSEWLTLNGVWEFKTANSTSDLKSPPFGGLDFEREILVPFPVESALSGIMESHIQFWYRKTFSVPSTWQGNVLLNFGAVDYEATVFINQKQVAFHRGGYFKFSVNLTPYLKPSELKTLVSVVYAAGKQTLNPSHIFYTSSSGIWQSVWLEPVPETYITKLDVDANMYGLVNITVWASDPKTRVPVKVTVHPQTESTNIITTSSTKTSASLLTAEGVSNTKFQFHVPSPNLWSPTTPNLYYFTVQLGNDTVTSYLGFRSIERRKDPSGVPRPFLNGQFVFHMGTLDQGFWPDGLYTAPTYEAMISDLKMLKDLGFNSVRKHIKIEPDLFYHACDTLGLLVWQDMPALNPANPPSAAQSAEFERQLYEMVSDLISVPSIVIWIIFNEGWGQTEGADFRYTQKVMEKDPHRLILSVAGWNASPQCGSPFFSKASSAYDPRRIGSQSEFGGVGHVPDQRNIWQVQKAKDQMNSTYEITANIAIWNYRALRVVQELREQVELFSCNAGIYTQTTDVEGEVNGLVTYDRRTMRADVKKWNLMLNSIYEIAKSRVGNSTARTFLGN